MKVIPDKIHLLDMRVLEFSFKSMDGIDSSTKQNPNLEIGMQHAISPEEKRLTFIFEGKLEIRNSGNEMLHTAHFKCKFLLEVENLEEFNVVEDGDVKYDAIIGLTCTGITYSTLRGILFEKLSGTPLEYYNLPVIDPKSLFN